MATDIPLFDDLEPKPKVRKVQVREYERGYPVRAGFKDGDTSKEAAEGVDAEFLRAAVLHALKRKGPMTADECAEAMRRDPLSIRPRFSELKNLGQIKDTGERRKNRSGKKAKVWERVFA
jgi:predicted HTH transcriptional regulator